MGNDFNAAASFFHLAKSVAAEMLGHPVRFLEQVAPPLWFAVYTPKTEERDGGFVLINVFSRRTGKVRFAKVEDAQAAYRAWQDGLNAPAKAEPESEDEIKAEIERLKAKLAPAEEPATEEEVAQA